MDDQDSEEEEDDPFAEPEDACEGFTLGEIDPIMFALRIMSLPPDCTIYMFVCRKNELKFVFKSWDCYKQYTDGLLWCSVCAAKGTLFKQMLQ